MSVRARHCPAVVAVLTACLVSALARYIHIFDMAGESKPDNEHSASYPSSSFSSSSMNLDQNKGRPDDHPEPVVQGTTHVDSGQIAEPESEKPNMQTSASGPPPPPPPPPPDGGLLAWMHVLGAFLLWFNTWGILNAFGVFQTYYESGQLFHASSSNISWIGSIQSFMLLFVGLFVGPLYDRGYLRHLLVFGSFLIVFGHMMLSLCHEFWQALLAQGFCVGIGAGCLFVPSVSVLPTYFSKRIGLAVGLGTSGSAIGGIIYPVVLYRLIVRIGFAWSVRVMAFIALGTLLVPIAIMRMRFKPPKPRAILDWTAFRDIPYMVFVLATLIDFIGLSIILFYLSYVAEARNITDTRMSFYLVAIFNGASTLGRTIPNALSDKIGPFNLLAPCAVATGVLIFCMMAVSNETVIIIVAVLVGFFSGVFIAMPPVCLVRLIEDKTKIGTRMGMAFGMISVGLLVGGPGGGNILGTTEPLDWRGLWTFGGVMATVSGLIYFGLRAARGGFGLLVKV